MNVRLRAKNETYMHKGGAVTSWSEEADKVLKDYSSLIDKNVAECNAWRFVGLVSVFLLAVAVGILVYCITLPKTDLVVIGVNDVGQARYYGVGKGNKFDDYQLRENCVKNIISTFIEYRYTISTDSEILYRNLSNCMYFLDQKKRKYFHDEIDVEDPFSNVGRIKRNVMIDTIIPVTDSSYQVEFYVTESELDGNRKVMNHLRAIFSVRQIKAKDYENLGENELLFNPLGIYITDYNSQMIKEF